MKTVIIALILLFASNAQALNSEQYTNCEKEFREKNKADKAAAPAGYKPDRPKGFKANFMINCLSK